MNQLYSDQITKTASSLLSTSEGALSSATPGGAGVVIADSGPLAQGFYRFFASMNCSAGASASFELRDAANATTLKTWTACANGQSNETEVPHFLIAAGQRVRIISGAAGTVLYQIRSLL